MIALLLFIVAGTAGFVVGQSRAERQSREFTAGVAAQGLANNLLVLRFMERGEADQAKRLLQAETNGQLGWIMEGQDPAPHCAALNTLKQYRAKRGLFSNPEWNDLWKMPGSKEEEEKRRSYLASLNCGDAKLYTVPDEAK